MEIVCNFVQQGDSSIFYKISNCTLPEKIYNLKVIHPPDQKNKDVKYLNIAYCNIKKIPQGLTNIFPNLEALVIEDTNLEKIYKTDLEEYKNLKRFYCDRNLIKFLGGNLFERFENLEKISFLENNIKIIEPTILDDLNNLNFVDFTNNVNYNCCYYRDNGTETLDEFKQKLCETFCSNAENVKKFVRKLQNKNKKLSASNIKHVIKIQSLEEDNRKLKLAKSSFITSYESVLEKSKLNMKIKRLESNEKSLMKEIQKLNIQTTNQSSQHQFNFNTDIKNLTKNKNFKDFFIQIDDQEFKVHKFVLAARSPILAEIFLANPEAENLKLVDISVDIFEAILHFMYNDELPGDKEINFLQLYSAAGRLGINELKNIAAQEVLKEIIPENAMETYMLSNKFKNTEMRLKAFTEIKKLHPDLSDNWIDKPDKVKKFIEVFGDE